ncbi:hypothetical protein EI372_00490 [Vibrio fluvialis]|nr:hypothetical protein [Vibrio fluvialis]
MCSSIQKYLDVLKDHQVTTHGVGARHKDLPLPIEGGRYLDNYTKLELSLSDRELEKAFSCLPLPSHWAEIQNHIGALKFLELWRGLEELRTGHRLRIQIGKLKDKHLQMTTDEFELWLDAQRLSKPWFEVYYSTSPEQYRFIWKTLYDVAFYPGRRTLRVYVPLFNTWNTHLKHILMFSLLDAGVPKYKVSQHLLFWTGQTASQSRINLASKMITDLNPSNHNQKSGEMV